MTDTSFFSPDGTSWNLQGPDVQLDPENLITKRVREYTNCGVIYTIFVCVHIASPRGIFYKLEVKRPLGVKFPTNPDHDFQVVKGLLTHVPITIAQYRAVEEKVLLRLADRQREEYFEQMRVYATVNKPVHVFAQWLDGHYYNDSIQVQMAQTRLNSMKAFAGSFIENLQHIKKLMYSVEGFLRIDITLTVAIPHLLMSTGIRIRGTENEDHIQTRGWLELQSGNDIDTAQDDTSNRSTRKDVCTVDATSTMVSNVKEQVGLHEHLNVSKDFLQEKLVNDEYDDHIDYYDGDEDMCFGGIMGVFCRSGLHGDYRGGRRHVECSTVR